MTQNMRHSRNSASSSWFLAVLSRLRYGQLTCEDMEKLNSVCYQPNLTDSSESDSNFNNSFDAFCPFIVSSHKVRVELNHQMMNTWASTTSTPLFEFDALVYFKGVLVEGNIRNSLNLLWDNKTGRLPMKLRLGLGMPMMCAVNMSPELKLCNGSIGHIVYIHHHKSNRLSLFSDGNLFVTKCTHIPEYVLLKLWKVDDVFFPALGPGVVLVKPFMNTSASVTLPNRTFTLRIKQIPLIPAFSLLIEKVQGSTMKTLILGPMNDAHRRNPQRTALHVLLSRGQDAYEMRLAEPLTLKDLDYFQPPANLIDEKVWKDLIDLLLYS
jgi:hypothetical protein